MRRIQAKYEEMPDLCLTAENLSRLFALELRDCTLMLGALVVNGFLRLTAAGFVRA